MRKLKTLLALERSKFYLTFVEHSIENFHFYQWYLDYESRYYQKLKNEPQAKYKKEHISVNIDDRITIPDGLPFKEEIEYVLQLFIYSNSKWELNIPYNLKAKLLLKLQYSTEPKQFNEVFNHIYNLLKNSSLKSFVN